MGNRELQFVVTLMIAAATVIANSLTKSVFLIVFKFEVLFI